MAGAEAPGRAGESPCEEPVSARGAGRGSGGVCVRAGRAEPGRGGAWRLRASGRRQRRASLGAGPGWEAAPGAPRCRRQERGADREAGSSRSAEVSRRQVTEVSVAGGCGERGMAGASGRGISGERGRLRPGSRLAEGGGRSRELAG